MKVLIRIVRGSLRVLRIVRSRVPPLPLVIALALMLEGCKKVDSCSVEDVYSKIKVDGKTGYSKAWLKERGVALCARHLGRLETYKDKHACSSVEDVFPDGRLPDILYGDSEALLLVHCPTASYPKAQLMQRVTCSTDIVFDPPDGPITRRLALHFDGADEALDCKLSVASNEAPSGTAGIIHTDKRGLPVVPRSPPVAGDEVPSNITHARNVPRSPPVAGDRVPSSITHAHSVPRSPPVASDEVPSGTTHTSSVPRSLPVASDEVPSGVTHANKRSLPAVPRSPPVDLVSQMHERQQGSHAASSSSSGSGSGNESHATLGRMALASIGADANPALLVGQPTKPARFSGQAHAMSPDVELSVDAMGATSMG